MGRLIVSTEFTVVKPDMRSKAHSHLDPSWFFADAYYDMYYNRGEGWRFSLESSFPHVSSIHDDLWKKENRKIDIRRFVERRLLGTALYHIHDLSYGYRSSYEMDGKRREFDSKVRHLYHQFFFEEKDDQMLFNLQYAGLVSEVLKRHPDYAEVSEEQISLSEMSPLSLY